VSSAFFLRRSRADRRRGGSWPSVRTTSCFHPPEVERGQRCGRWGPAGPVWRSQPGPPPTSGVGPECRDGQNVRRRGEVLRVSHERRRRRGHPFDRPLERVRQRRRGRLRVRRRGPGDYGVPRRWRAGCSTSAATEGATRRARAAGWNVPSQRLLRPARGAATLSGAPICLTDSHGGRKCRADCCHVVSLVLGGIIME